MRRYGIVPAPSGLGLQSTGVELLPEALLSVGLADRLTAVVTEPVRPGPFDPRRDPDTGLLNVRALARYARKLADAVEGVLDQDRFPVVLGGDCTILLGNLLALRRRGRHGLLFVDGHADFYQPEANVNGEAASSELALATGRGPESVTVQEGFWPLVDDESVVVVGQRDAVEAAKYGSQSLPDSVTAFDLPTLRALGSSHVSRATLERLERKDLGGFWIHFDVDVLDDAVMPAVDYRQPGGLSWTEATELLTAPLGSTRARGLDVTIFNPELDSSGRLAAELVEFLVGILEGSESDRRRR